MRCSGSTSPMFTPRRSSRLRGKPSCCADWSLLLHAKLSIVGRSGPVMFQAV
jgi:hypothetical protein